MLSLRVYFEVHAVILSNKNKEEDVNEKFSICRSHWPSISDKHGTFLQKKIRSALTRG
jgi:hypothetical protein